uniref:Uncharacterized protein n=1 Tax=Kalanchoe fedtschenkoi TaxID=63787 RepID=A0A7N0ZU77_KALFE
MGTEYEYAVNLMFSSAANSRKSSSIVDKETELQTVADIQRLQSSMDRMIDELRSFETIKKAMLEHDRIFQHQVKELHRVYGVQRTLMSELKYKARIRAGRRAESANLATRHHPEAAIASGYSLNAPVLKPYPSFNETTGSASGDNLAKPGCFDLEMPARGASTAEGKNSPTAHSEEEADVELTLSIGNAKNGNKRMKKIHHHHHRQPHFEQERNGSAAAAAAEDPGRGEECSRTATSDQDRKRPHWLFQSLSSLHQT